MVDRDERRRSLQSQMDEKLYYYLTKDYYLIYRTMEVKQQPAQPNSV